MDFKSNVFWTDEALINLDNIIFYLSSNWTEKEVKKFLKKLDHAVLLIAQRPNLFPHSVYKLGARRFVLTKQVSIIYTVTNLNINILSLFDTRQDPQRM